MCTSFLVLESESRRRDGSAGPRGWRGYEGWVGRRTERSYVGSSLSTLSMTARCRERYRAGFDAENVLGRPCAHASSIIGWYVSKRQRFKSDRAGALVSLDHLLLLVALHTNPSPVSTTHSSHPDVSSSLHAFSVPSLPVTLSCRKVNIPFLWLFASLSAF
jgi:hypothetical protein